MLSLSIYLKTAFIVENKTICAQVRLLYRKKPDNYKTKHKTKNLKNSSKEVFIFSQ